MKIKQLDWKPDEYNGIVASFNYYECASSYRISTHGSLECPYTVTFRMRSQDNYSRLYFNGEPITFATVDEAKTYCQADFEKQVNLFLQHES